jgi:plastocyanin
MRTTVLAVLLLIAATLAIGAEKKPPPPDVTIKEMKFDPDTLKVKVGQTIVWRNDDDRDHTVAADDKSFKSENLKNGDTFRYTFKKAGKYPYSCTYHPRMKATIIVQEKSGG